MVPCSTSRLLTSDSCAPQPPPPPSRADLERTDYAAAAPPAYAYMAEFQSHEQEVSESPIDRDGLRHLQIVVHSY